MNEYLVISEGSCTGEEEQFLTWMEEHYPAIESSIESVIVGSYTDDDCELVDEHDPTGNQFWEEYCNE